MIVRQFLHWVRTAAASERAEATGALARAYLFSDLSQCAPLRIREPESGRQACTQDAVLGGQLLILQQQLLIDEARHKSQKACQMGGVAHVAGLS